MVAAIIIAGTQSGVGKTLVSIGLMAALHKRGLRVQPFKVGPDYIDPGYHKRVTGNPSYTLDGWMMGKEAVSRAFFRNIRGKDIAVIEGVMGLFDGRSGLVEEGSTAEISKLLGVPVLLVIDAKGMARSSAAVLKGFESFDETNIVGAVFNRVGSDRHKKYISDAAAAASCLPVFGFLPREKSLEIESRHLGLLMSEEKVSDKLISLLSTWMEENVDLTALLESAAKVEPVAFNEPVFSSQIFSLRKRGKIAVARDRAFSFYYEENLDALREQGAELLFFSPMSDSRLPRNIDLVYIGGGYPELFSKELEANVVMRENIKAYSKAGGRVYAECGGFMYLCKKLRNGDQQYSMTGVFPFDVEMTSKLQALGYLDVKIKEEASLFRKGTQIRGHQFRYSKIVGDGGDIKRVYGVEKMSDGTQFLEGYKVRNVLGSYIHLHFRGTTLS
ncbi:MAG: cobyrinate a,c-diamide synthase [Nitrospinota bacterium]